MSDMRRTLLVIAALSSGAASAAALPQGSCRVDAEPTRRIELPDGRVVSTDVKSIARSGGWVMASGPLAYVFPVGANPRSDAMIRDSIIGFVLDTRGNTSVVPNPPSRARAYHARVAPGTDGSFHVLYVTTEDNPNGLAPTADTATIWYARYQKGRWTGIERITSTRGARLLPELASALLERDGQLSFVFPFATTESKGLVMMRRLTSRWRLDTLRTSAEPGAVTAIHDSSGSLVAAFAMSGRGIDPTFTDVLFEARFRESWSAPRRVAGDGRRPVTIPALLRVGRNVVTSWVDWTWGNSATSQLHWLSATDSSPRHVASGSATYPYEAVVLRDRYPLWLIRGPRYGTTLSVLIGVGSTVEQPGTLEVPFENPKASAIPLGDDRVLVLTMKQGKLPDEPMVASYATILRIRCPEPARRE
jgi:hypothetical protein